MLVRLVLTAVRASADGLLFEKGPAGHSAREKRGVGAQGYKDSDPKGHKATEP